MKHAPRFCARPGAHPEMFLALSGVSIPQQKSASANKTGKCKWLWFKAILLAKCVKRI